MSQKLRLRSTYSSRDNLATFSCDICVSCKRDLIGNHQYVDCCYVCERQLCGMCWTWFDKEKMCIACKKKKKTPVALRKLIIKK
jgi:hypothetical protein